ncbi:PAS domain S-box protein [Candidatus Magnetaquicoccus inordinatus]|uniref:PAS domain S-box protein n=1 Tax=Candidatus Magnetaquicoccus inordinatus TaxID=2496818 RepID=UPI00102CCB5C|nr:PAS domain S-box protein [Candidatus Magnetaquicoccus inordinatus]
MHRLLARQIKRIFALDEEGFVQGVAELQQRLGDSDASDAAKRICSGLLEFSRRVGESYEQQERDLELRNRSLLLSSDELNRFNERLRAQAEQQQRVIDSLQETANRLLLSSGQDLLRNDDSSLEQLTVLMARLVEDYLLGQSRLQEAHAQLERQKFALDQHAIVSITDTAGHILYANDKFCRVSGYSKQELLGQDHRMVGSGQHDKAFFRHLWQTIANGEVWEGEICNRSRSGDLYWVAATIVPYLNERGKPIQYIAIRTDITAQKIMEEQLRESRNFLQSLTDSMGEGVYALDIRGRCTFLNREAERLLGWSRDELLFQHLHETVHYLRADGSTLTRDECPIWLANRAGEIYRSEDEHFIHRSGQMFPVSVVAVPIIEEGRIVGSVAVFQDISARKLMEEQLKRAMYTAEAASRAKSDFLANMSHEIRTPMNAIIGMSHLALHTDLTPRQRDYVSKIHGSAKTLLRILNDILDFSKIEAGRLELESVLFRLDEVLETVITLVAVRAYEKGLELLCSRARGVPVHLRGDPLRLQQVMLNLLGNAVKFTERGEVELRVEVKERRSSEVELLFSVRDSGIGIKAEQIETLFDSFTQADSSTTRQYGGTGLGLAISRRLVELMGGAISASSRPGEGSQFRFTVLMGLIADEAEEWQPAPELRGLKIGLSVENQRNREILHELLGSLTFQICEEHPSEPTLRPGGWNEKPDLLLSDYCSAERNGLQWLLGQRSWKELSHLPAVILCPQPEMVRMQEACGSLARVRTLPKPVTASQLFDAVAELFGAMPISHKATVSRDTQWVSGFRSLAGKRVLLTEDNPVNQQVAVDLLEMVGLEVEVAGNGREAVEALRKLTFDVVLMDVQMPVMDGYDATRALRQELGVTIPIIAMTANAMVGDREKSLQAGMNDHVAKPIDPQHLFSTLHKWLQKDGQSGDEKIESLGQEMPTGESMLGAVGGEIAGINRAEALRRCANNPALLERLLRRFAIDQQDVARRLRESWGQGEQQEAIRLAHTLKGLAGSIGAEALQEAARQLEQGLMEASAEVAQFLERVESILNPLLLALAALFSAEQEQEKVPQRAELTLTELQSLLEPLREPLKARQAKVCQGLVEPLEKAAFPLSIQGRVHNLLRLVKKYRLKEAEVELLELLQQCTSKTP